MNTPRNRRRNRFSQSRYRLSLPGDVEAVAGLSVSLQPERDLTEEESWKIDESWTAIMAYVAHMTLPREG